MMKAKWSIKSDVLWCKIGVYICVCVYIFKITKPNPENSWTPNLNCPWSICIKLLLLDYSFLFSISYAIFLFSIRVYFGA